jgi:hypothetical protein
MNQNAFAARLQELIQQKAEARAGRLAELDAIHLRAGNHGENEAQRMCAMEAVAYVAGEPWSDHPECACPVLGSFMRSWNDGLPSDAARDRLLKPFVAQLVDTKATPEIESHRGFMALDWLIRVNTPKWLDLVPSLAAHAKALRDLEEIADLAGATAAGEKMRAAQAASAAAWDAARDASRAAAVAAARDVAVAAARDVAVAAARDAARAAAGAAAWDASRAAARDAAWDAAGAAAVAAAWDAAVAAARDAAWDAAWDAAGDAAGAALKPTTEWLQASAMDLLTRMIYADVQVAA